MLFGLFCHPVITENSMLPTLRARDRVFARRLVGNPRRGDIVIFRESPITRFEVKRVAGLPGETIQFLNNRLIVNGKGENYPVNIPIDLGPYKVANDGFFMLGDNPPISIDSRHFHEVRRKNISYKVYAIICPPDRWKFLV